MMVLLSAQARFLAVVLMLALAAPAWSQNSGFDQAVESSGDLLQFALPLTALGFTFLFGDQDAEAGNFGLSNTIYDTYPVLGRRNEFLHKNVIPGSRRGELITAVSRAYLVTYGLKYGVDAERPNGAGQSFPSGHTALSFTGAAFINKHYGWKPGIPAFLAASYVGWSRVHSDNHYWSDVIAGAAVGIASNYFMGDGKELGPGRLTLAPSLLASGTAVLPGLHIGFEW